MRIDKHIAIRYVPDKAISVKLSHVENMIISTESINRSIQDIRLLFCKDDIWK